MHIQPTNESLYDFKQREKDSRKKPQHNRNNQFGNLQKVAKIYQKKKKNASSTFF